MAANSAWWEAFPTVLWRIGGRYVLFAGFAFLLFYVWKRSAWITRKIQPRFPGRHDLGREVFYSMLTILIFAAVVTVVMFHPKVRPWTRLMDLPNQRGWFYYFLIFPVLLVLHDTYFYWAHRMMHLSLLYKWVHRVHHQSTNPSPWAAYAFHPWEALVEVGILPLFVMGLPLHKSHVVLFFLFMIVYNVYGHLGYELYPASFVKSKWGSWVNTSRHHNLHHARFQGNYGLYFLIWDRWMGTLKAVPEASASILSEAKPFKTKAPPQGGGA